MRQFIALAALVAGLSVVGNAAQAADCCSGGKGGTCGKGCTTCGPHCSPKPGASRFAASKA